MSEEKSKPCENEIAANKEAKGWFKWMIIAFIGFPAAALIFVILPKIEHL